MQSLTNPRYVVLSCRPCLCRPVQSRSHIDLRQAGSLDSFVNVSFVMFLACEVGGSKFMLDQAGSTQLDIIQHNVQIYQVVFEYLSECACVHNSARCR